MYVVMFQSIIKNLKIVQIILLLRLNKIWT